jgi:hypothetical protein
MFRVRTSSWLALVALALAWTATASAAPPSGLRAAGERADTWVVDDADFVLVVNVKQLAAAELMKKDGMKAFNDTIKHCEQAQALIDATGLKPFEDIDSILVSGLLGPKAANARGVMVVHGRFDPVKAVAVARKKSEVEVLKGGTTDMIKLKVMDQNAYAAFLDKSTLVVTQSQETTTEWIKSGGKKAARMSPSLKTALGSFKGTESVTFALVVNDELKKLVGKVPQLAVAGPKLQTLTARVTVGEAAELEVVASTSDDKATRKLQDAVSVLKGVAEVMLQADDGPLGKAAGDLVEQVKVTRDKDGVHVNFKLTREQIDKVGKAGK